MGAYLQFLVSVRQVQVSRRNLTKSPRQTRLRSRPHGSRLDESPTAQPTQSSGG